MEIDLANLPEDAEALKVLVHQLVGTVKTQGLKIAQFEARLVKLKRMQFGQSSEKLVREIEQLELELDALHEEEASTSAQRPAAVQKLIEKPYRKPLPNHLPREEEVHELRISRISGGDFTRSWARVSRHCGQPFRGSVRVWPTVA